jgi:Cu(I)/Ag(I) efflux system protein CusF
MSMFRVLGRAAAILILSAGLSGVALAQKTDRVEGEVRRINEAEGKVTLRHGPLPNLDMPAMTMVFTAKDPAILKGIKVGEKVNFVTETVNGVFYVLEISKP